MKIFSYAGVLTGLSYHILLSLDHLGGSTDHTVALYEEVLGTIPCKINLGSEFL